MPLSASKQQSQSIEDLIAQLDSPTDKAEITNGSRTISVSSASSAPAEPPLPNGDIGDRKMLKGKRTLTAPATSSGGSSPTHPSSANDNGSVSPTSAGKQNHTFVRANSFGQNSEPILSRNIIASKRYTKNSRAIKGLAKKGGAGGKGTWGAPGCEITEEEFIDTKDPNYDSEDDRANVVMVCVEGGGEGKELTAEELESGGEVRVLMLEYFQNGDTIEVIDQLKCFKMTHEAARQLVTYLVQTALEHNNTCKELTSRLLRDLTVELLTDESVFVHGFDALLKNLPELVLDNPEAPEKIGTFIARAIADKVLSKSYLDRVEETLAGNEPALAEKLQKAVESARVLVNMNDHLFHLSHIWGHKGGFSAVRELSDKINELIQEYHDSGDMAEAVRCLRELNVPHFHHEFVYEALDFALQKGTDTAIELTLNLLQNLYQAAIVTYDQLKMGFVRIYDVFPDIILDVPNANNLMEKILNSGQSKGFISEDIMDLAPNRSRKRFVSEGDGGRIKSAENGY